MTYPSPYTPALFEHTLDPDLFTGDRLNALCREADGRGSLKVQFADPGRQRYGNDPIYTKPSYPILDDVRRRPIQYRITGVDLFDPAYAACRDQLFEIAGPDPELGRFDVVTVVRVFTPGVLVALHGDPDLKLVATIAGETIWWARPPDAMTREEQENLLRGNFFLEWQDYDDTELRIPPGHGCFLPSRWPHWLSHPGDVPVVSFEMGFWTKESIHARKVYDVNWLMRKVGLKPKDLGEGDDALKCRVFDAVSTLTRKGTQYRGI